MKRRKLIAIAVLALAALVASGVAEAQKIRVGDIILTADGGFSADPAAQARKRADHACTAAARSRPSPATSRRSSKTSTSNSTVTARWKRSASPSAPSASWKRRPSPEPAHACPGAIVGKGYGHAIVAFPESKPINVDSPITLFNGPKKHGNPTVLAHAYTTYPAPVTLIVPIVIERIHKGVYGYRTKAKIPKIAGGAGIPISGHLKIGRKWTYKGKKHSYVNARCETGHLQARVEATFKDDTFLSGVFIRACQVRR